MKQILKFAVFFFALGGMTFGQTVTGGDWPLTTSPGHFAPIPQIGQTLTCPLNTNTCIISGSGLISGTLASPTNLNAPALGKKVEPLTAEEIKLRDDAQKKLDAAQAELDVVLSSIKTNPGETHGGLCSSWQTNVTLWGGYALIDTSISGGCVANYMGGVAW